MLGDDSLIPQGLQTLLSAPPNSEGGGRKGLPVTCSPLPVPLWFLGCLLLVAMVTAAVGTTPGFCGEGPAPPLEAHRWEGGAWEAWRGGPFKLSLCVWSLTTQVP